MRPGGVSDAANELNMSRQAFAKLRERPDFPDPLGETSSGPIWNLDSLVSWAASRARSGPGRPSAEATHRQLGGRFELQGPAIGSGGFASVYRALDRKTGEMVAVKVLHANASATTQRRFLREARLLQGFDHRHVIRVLGAGENHLGEPWYAMPLAAGSLDDELRNTAGDEALIIDIMRQLCAGLAYIHERALHRDLKPQNILRIESGIWAIADFGLAHDALNDSTTLTGSLGPFGTGLYAAPEQWTNPQDATETADIFSLGKVLAAMVLGWHPGPYEVPEGNFRHIIVRATRQDAPSRYQRVSEMFADIEAVAAARSVVGESLPAQLERISERIQDKNPDYAILREYLDLSLALGEDVALREEFIQLVPHLSTPGLIQLWDHDPDKIRLLFTRYTATVRHRTTIQFAFCDTIADFYARALEVTKDPDILQQAISGLIDLGARHNRWYVRDTLIDILQNIRTTGDAIVAAKGLAEVPVASVSWTLTDFAVRTLHAVLRDAVESLMAETDVA